MLPGELADGELGYEISEMSDDGNDELGEDGDEGAERS